jgi:hypothetical protein
MSAPSEQLAEAAPHRASAIRRRANVIRPAAREPGPAYRFLLTVGLYAIPLVVALRPVASPVCDPDLWWHLRVGQWVVDHRAVPATDPFSAYGEGRPWVAYSWLYEVLLYGLYTLFGIVGVVVYRTAMVLAIAAAVHRLVLRRGPPALLSAGLAAACLLPVAMLFSERPWLFTILFGTLTLHVVFDLREGRRSKLPWLLPALFVVWANVHIQFVYGLALLVLASFAPLIDRFWRVGDEATSAAFGSRRWRKVTVLVVVCSLCTLFNPYHLKLYGVVLEYSSQPGPFRFVNELKSPEFREASDWAMLGLAGMAAFALGRRQRLTSFDVLLLAGCAVLSFRSRRDLWLVALATAGILSAGPFNPAPAGSPQRWTLRATAGFAVVLAVLAYCIALARDLSPSRLERTVAGVFPVDAACFVAEHGYPGPLYNDFNWGGYLIWALPQLPVAIDGRTNLHGDERLMRFGATWAGGREWHDDPDLVAAEIIIADSQTPLASLLGRDERFALVYEDAVARVFVARRKTPR